MRGFPTLFFVPKNDKSNPRKYEVNRPVRFNSSDGRCSFQSGREVNDFIKYLAKEATEPLTSYDRDGNKKSSGKIGDGEL